MRRPYFPMYTDISDLRVVVVGSGEEARKCIRTLAAYTGHLIVISETADPQLLSMKEAYGFELRCRQYAREELFGADIAVAASGDAGIDGDIYAACKCLGIRVHTCGNEAKSDFFFEQREKLPEPVSVEEKTAQDVPVREEILQPPQERMQVTIYTDGAARGNPKGPGGYAAVIEFTGRGGTLHTKEISGGYARTTNNRMELMAAIAGLEALIKPCEVCLYSDSKYLVDAFNQHWIDSWIRNGWRKGTKEPVKNISLWKRLLAAKEPHSVSFRWVKGHNGHPQNERCDELATAAADAGNLPPDDLGE